MDKDRRHYFKTRDMAFLAAKRKMEEGIPSNYRMGHVIYDRERDLYYFTVYYLGDKRDKNAWVERVIEGYWSRHHAGETK